MNKRKFLSVAVGSLFACLFFVFGWVYFYGLTSSPNTTSDFKKADVSKLFKDVAVGTTVLQRLKNQRVWVVHLSSKQRSQIGLIDQFVGEPEAGCDLNKVFCLLDAMTNRDGVYLQFTLKEPPQLPVDTPWFGGFVDPASGAIYDLIGRAYQQNKGKFSASIKQLTIKQSDIN